MKKITSFYYLNYPDQPPENPLDAYSEVYVEIGNEKSDINNFEKTYSLHVYTANYIKRLLHLSSNQFIYLHSGVIVEKFEDTTIREVLDTLLDKIDDFGSVVS